MDIQSSMRFPVMNKLILAIRTPDWSALFSSHLLSLSLNALLKIYLTHLHIFVCIIYCVAGSDYTFKT